MDLQTSVSAITVRASDNPHGVFSFSVSSLNLEFNEESDGGAFLIVDRKFGSIGKYEAL